MQRKRRGEIERDAFRCQCGCGIKIARLAGKIRVKSGHKFMPDSDEFLNPLEKVGLLLLNGSPLHQCFVCILDVENDELPYQQFRIKSLR